MSDNIVAHPETGQPVKQEVSYVSIERSQLEQEVAAKQAELDAANQAVTDHSTQAASLEEAKTKAEAALADSKSNLETFDGISPQPSVEAGAEGAGSEVENTEQAGDASSEVSEPSGDNGEGAEEVAVPVQVEGQENAEASADEADEY